MEITAATLDAMIESKKDSHKAVVGTVNEIKANGGMEMHNGGKRTCEDGRMNDPTKASLVTCDSKGEIKCIDEPVCKAMSTNEPDYDVKSQEDRNAKFEKSSDDKVDNLHGDNDKMCTHESNKNNMHTCESDKEIKYKNEFVYNIGCDDESIDNVLYKTKSLDSEMFKVDKSAQTPTHEYKPCRIFTAECISAEGYKPYMSDYRDGADATNFANYNDCSYYPSIAHESTHVIPLLASIYSTLSKVITDFKSSYGTLERVQSMISWYKHFVDEHKRYACIDSPCCMDTENVPMTNSESNINCAMEILRNMETCTSMPDYTIMLQGSKCYRHSSSLHAEEFMESPFQASNINNPEDPSSVESLQLPISCLYSVETPQETRRMKTVEIESITVSGGIIQSIEDEERTKGSYTVDPSSAETPHALSSTYTFPLASRVTCNCLLKVVVNHAVAGLYIGKNGTHLKMLQEKYRFRLTQSGRGIRGDFTGVGYPCHRTNTTLLFDGPLVHILYALRPLYRIIQDDMLALDQESTRIVNGHTLRVKFELNLVVPVDRKRVLLQNAGKRCMQLRNTSGVDIIAGKQNFELGNIRESIVTLLGFDDAVERACEWLCIFIQDSDAISSGDYMFMEYPKYTLAVPEH
ncbi:hypothetical protein BEWA_039950 [Theileria equi strain WA]|uniref:K Homology domain-containing protein n=1 Tax=Theileria equi strain WA TaxID=1537102 RepID=L1LET5_THEEQ|nr:hypothetical protein BEWA_039950 [Theileria equi strain WA]EKX73957.1 hypothetical protein BEWA_039950 [Theileria equi strain WA]|eukprot:XP_004833409.1 hypothetical protein BEWA_039950 [Theileria equi strain WA]